MQNTASELAQELSTKLQDDMDFTLKSHYLERIRHHMKMLKYYLDETMGT